MDDIELLQQYAKEGSERPFRILVERHLDLVHSVALRQVRDPQLAEEVSQAVFILLSRKARTLHRGVVLSGWLFRTTRFVASRALRSEQRRRQREQEAFEMQHSAADDPTWKRVAPALDSALEHLGRSDRDALLLRFYQERNHQEVGAALGISEDAARKRVARALERLRKFFAGHGFTISTVSLGSLIAANAVMAAPVALTHAVTAATLKTALPASALPVLVRETVAAWTWFKVKVAATLVLTGAAVIVPTILSTSNSDQDAPANATFGIQNVANSPGPDGAPVGLAATAQVGLEGAASGIRGGGGNGSGALRLFVFSRNSGEPVPHASLAVNTVNGGHWEQRFDLRTDSAGSSMVPVPPAVSRLDVGIASSGWATRFVNWTPDSDDPVPAEYILLVDPVTNAIGGWIRDLSGNPVPNAQIWIQIAGSGDASAIERSRERRAFVTWMPVCRSDDTGRWTCAVVPPRDVGFTLKATHPDFAPTEIESANSGDQDQDLKRETFQQLWAGALVTTLSPEISLSGRVIDGSGAPVAGAELVHQPFSMNPKVARSDAQGHFRFNEVPSGQFDFTAIARGYGPEYRQVTTTPGMPPMEVELKPAATLRVRVVDQDGFGVPGVTVGLEQWGTHRQELKWAAQSGADGVVEWDSAPPNDSLEIYAHASGWCYARNIWVTADATEHIIQMRRALVLDGLALDSETGEPVAEVKAYPGYGEGEYAWERLDTRKGIDGRFRVLFGEDKNPWRVRVEAPGYLPATSEPVSNDFAGMLHILLHPERSATHIAGVVFLPDGQPAAGVEVALCTFEQMIGVRVAKGRFEEQRSSKIQRTDREGRFSFKPDPEAHTLVAIHSDGFARVRVNANGAAHAIGLQPWGRIEGAVLNLPYTAETIAFVSDWAAGQYRGGISLGSEFQGRVDDTGRFTIESVPPGNLFVSIRRDGGVNAETAGKTAVSVRPGETVQVEIGGRGVAVTGRFVAGDVETPLDWKRQTTVAHLIPLSRTPLPVPAGLAGDARKWWELEYWLSPAGHARLAGDRGCRLWVEADGSFRGYDVLPGKYRLGVHVTEGMSTPLIGEVSYDFVIQERSGDEPQVVDLGTHGLRKPRKP